MLCGKPATPADEIKSYCDTRRRHMPTGLDDTASSLAFKRTRTRCLFMNEMNYGGHERDEVQQMRKRGYLQMSVCLGIYARDENERHCIARSCSVTIPYEIRPGLVCVVYLGQSYEMIQSFTVFLSSICAMLIQKFASLLEAGSKQGL